MRMACPTAVRITGSDIRRPSKLNGLSTFGARLSFNKVLVTTNPIVDASTSRLSAAPRCFDQSSSTILSLIKSSIVGPSGTRNMASAKHIKEMPSSVERPYSARNVSISPCCASSRNCCTKRVASSLIFSRSAALNAAMSTRRFTASASSGI